MKNTIHNLLLALILVLATPSVWAAEKITYYHNDALGSPIAATDENGKILWKEDYHPYGSRIRKESTDSNQQWYTGKHHENDIGLTYFGARWYDPSIGRFMAIDPVGFKEGNIQSHNRYAYANNNPYLFVDPDGRAAILYPIATFILKELGSEAVEQTTGIQMPTVKNAGKAVTKQIGKKLGGNVTKSVTVSKGRFPQSAKHIEDAVASGKPNTLTINRAGATANRRDSLRGVKTKPGLDRDEFPPAMFQEGGRGASVRHINRGDNRGAGACIGAQCRGLSDGTRVRIDVVD